MNYELTQTLFIMKNNIMLQKIYIREGGKQEN